MPSDIDEIHAFLLGSLPEERRDAFEERMFADEEFFDRVEFAEDELIDAYISGELPLALRGRFETSFLKSPRRRDRLELAVALSEFRTQARPANRSSQAGGIAVWLWSFTKWPAPVAAVFGLAVLFGASSVWLGSTLMKERRIAADQRRLAEQQLAELSRRTEPAPPPPQKEDRPQPDSPAKAPGKRDPQLTLAFLLVPNATRGEDFVITVPAEVKSVQLTLRTLTGITPGKYQAIIRDRSQHEIWQRDLFQKGNHSNTLTASVSANVLSPGAFTLALSAYQADGNLEVIADYAFRVAR